MKHQRNRVLAIAVAVPCLVAGVAAVGVAGSSAPAESRSAAGAPERVDNLVRAQAVVDRAKARAAAVRHIERRTGQPARATWTGRENDFGARWEVEVKSAGREFDVYVSRSGAVVKVKAKGRASGASTPAVAQAGLSRTAAAAVAQQHIAKQFGQSARVTWSGPEDDFGAQWEIEVTLADGREFDVYVARSGAVVKVVAAASASPGQPGQSAPPTRPTPPTQQPGNGAGAAETSRSAAAEIARSHAERVYGQSARVTWSGPEDDFGARWEIEVTLADGREFDVYVAANGSVVAVR